MNVKYKFSIIGGDMRCVMLCKLLASEGHELHTFALEPTGGFSACNSIQRSYNLCEIMSISDILIFPIPFSADGDYSLNAPFHAEKIPVSLIEQTLRDIDFSGVIIGGKIPAQIKSYCAFSKAACFDLLERDDLAILNSVPTAEGALQIAMEELPYTIRGTKALVCGMGRVGSTLARLMKNMGADITVAVRKSKDFAVCEAEGLKYTNYEELPKIISEMKLIYNTVPCMIFNSALLDTMSQSTLLIDLASKPGGVDFEYAKIKGIRAIHALSLPGKVAPVDAAKIIQKVIFNVLNEEYFAKGS